MSIDDERLEKLKIITQLYKHRSFTQEIIAKELGISIADVSKACKLADYHHTNHRDSNNDKYYNEYRDPFIHVDDLRFLDKYDIDTLRRKSQNLFMNLDNLEVT